LENIYISKIKEKSDNPQTKKFLKIYQEGIQRKSKCPLSLFNIIITLIILIVFIIIINLLKILFLLYFFFLRIIQKIMIKKEKISYLFNHKLFL